MSDCLSGMLARVADGSGDALAVIGPAGIGKTALLNYAADAATDFLVIRARGVPLESKVSYAGLTQILDPLLALSATLAPGQADAVAGAMTVGGTTEAFPLYMGTLNLLAEAASATPVIVLVDDVQWLDVDTVTALQFVQRRLSHDAICLLLAARSDTDVPQQLEDFPTVALAGLGPEAAAQLLAAQGYRVADDFVGWLVSATGGNPLALQDLPTYLPAPELATLVHSAQPVPISPSLERAYGRAVGLLPEAGQQATVIAALLDDAEARVLVRALEAAGLALTDLEAAEDAGLVDLAGGTVGVRHPLMRSAAIQQAKPTGRRAAHRAAAEGLLESTRSHDRETRVWHLAQAAIGVDEQTATLLEDVAGASLTRAGFAAASSAYRKAAALSERGPARTRRLLEAAEAAFMAGQVQVCERLLDQAEEEADATLDASRVAHLRGRIETWSGTPAAAADRMRHQAERYREVDPAFSIKLAVDATAAAAVAGQMRQASEAAELVTSIARSVGPVAGPIGDLLVGSVQAMRGDGDAARPLLDHCRMILTAADPSPELLQPLVYLATSYHFIDAFEEALPIYDRAITHARRQGAVGQLPFALAHLASSQYRMGRWDAAVANASEALELAELSGRSADRPIALVMISMVEAARGQERARSRAAAALDQATATGSLFIVAQAHSVLGLLDLTLGRTSDAIVSLRRCEQLAVDLGLMELGYLQWAAELVEACVRSGDRRDTDQTMKTIRDATHDQSTALNRAVLARCEGLTIEDRTWEDHFRLALTLHNSKPTRPFELARTQLCFGERLRRDRKSKLARIHLSAAWQNFATVGAAGWAERAAWELRATGGTTPGPIRHKLDLLTPQEFQVAQAVSTGLSNREVADTLFLSQKTIEFHLSSCYRRLGIRSRSELTELISDRQRRPTDSAAVTANRAGEGPIGSLVARPC